MTQMLTTCFTDIKGSTPLTENLGHERIMPILEEHIRIGKCLMKENKGTYVKNVGDAHMGTFASFEEAIRFATEFQQYLQKQPCLERQDLLVRVALYLGAVEPKNEDVFGSGVNKASRVEGLTEPGHVTVNADLYKNMISAWGKDKTDKYFVSVGEHELKGIDRKEELFAFRWQSYATDHAYASLASRVHRCLEDASTVPTNLNEYDLTPPGVIIWPVVPRELATAIHRGQIEIIRLLALLGWRVHLLIADCGTDGEGMDRIKTFVSAILAHLKFRNVCNAKVDRLSEYFDAKYPGQTEVIEQFRSITTKLTVKNLTDINSKDYAEDDLSHIQKNAALNFLRPILTCATVLHLTKEFVKERMDSKIIIVAGEDETVQWQHVIELEPNYIGAIFNPSLRKSDPTGQQHTARQGRTWPIWYAKKTLIEEMKTSNAAKWVFQMFAQIPCFPSKAASIGGTDFCTKNWTDEFTLPGGLKVDDLVEAVWPMLDPGQRRYQ
jgi:class 3 adenylate cyclase